MKIQNFINGELSDPLNNCWLESVEPATATTFAQVPDSGADDIQAAVAAAKSAFPGWSSQSISERAKRLNRLADAIDAHRDELAELESKDNGKTVVQAKAIDIPRSAENLRHFAATIIAQNSTSHAMPNGINYTLREPLGVVGVISPWNLPLYLLTWKIAPALAAGNCVVGKPSEITPATAFRLSEICRDVGLPKGVLNIVHGSGEKTGNALLKHPDIKAVSFTGGTATGRHVASVVAPQFKKLSLELGGKNPNIIFADCDYPKMLETTIRSSFSNQGQICLCGSRIYIEEPIYQKFKRDFVVATKKLNVGDPKLRESDLGAVVSAAHFEKIMNCIQSAQAEGGTVLTGGDQVDVGGRCKDGYFVAPTIIEGLGIDCATNQTEIFGPVVTLAPFSGQEEAIELANGTDYGLSASIWTNDLQCAHRVARRIEAGVVWINCWLVRDLRTPFGGVKQSGVGREGGDDSLRFFTESKNICVHYNGRN